MKMDEAVFSAIAAGRDACSFLMPEQAMRQAITAFLRTWKPDAEQSARMSYRGIGNRRGAEQATNMVLQFIADELDSPRPARLARLREGGG